MSTQTCIQSYQRRQEYLAELSVYGFIREQHRNTDVDGTPWPEDLNKLSLLMYFIFHSEMEIDPDQNSVESPADMIVEKFEAIGGMPVKKGNIKSGKSKQKVPFILE